ncbi:MAG: prepilin-type N-terminal cleavage/methylation domain-containing protein [Pseudomonadota bacterium]
MDKSEYNLRLIREIEENRLFLLTMYRQNPELLKHADKRIAPLLHPLEVVERKIPAKQHGISLIELIIFIVIISTAMAGILLVMDRVTRSSADPLLRKQALAVAESLLEEIRLQDLDPARCTGALGPDADRGGAGCANDYNGYNTTAGILDFSSNSGVAGLENYNITGIAVTNLSDIGAGTFGGTAIPAGSGVQITVTVADPAGVVVSATGYRAGN